MSYQQRMKEVADRSAAPSLPEICPQCRNPFDGEVTVIFKDRQIRTVFQNKQIGHSVYTWVHTPDECTVPQLSQLQSIKL